MRMPMASCLVSCAVNQLVPSSVSNRTFMLAQALVDAFSAATTLCGLHFMACAVSIWAVEALGLADRAPLPREGEQCFCVSK